MLTNERVFEEEFVPAEVVHRHDEVTAVSEALAPIERGGPTEVTFLFGPTGAGKTCVARYTAGQLTECHPNVEVVYVNCWQEYTRFRVLYRLLEGLGETHGVHRGSTAKDELFARLRETVEDPYVVILDEADQLADDEVLYDLYRVPEVSLVPITNAERDLFDTLDDRVRSRLGPGRRVRFDRYTTDQLTDILARRAEVGLAPDAVDEPALRRIADRAAGDARVAIRTLRAAVARAAEQGCDRVTDAVVDAAVPRAGRTVEQSALDRLSDHQRVVFDVVAQRGPIDPGDLYEAYTERVTDPRSKRMVRKYLRQLEQYDLVESHGENRGRTYAPA
jgi:orc1/cdc6 family replication initiation protein